MIPQAEFSKALKTAVAFIDPGLPGLHVVHFNFITSDNFEMVATDGHRLVTIEFSAAHSCPPGTRVSVPLPMVEDILARFPADVETEIMPAAWDGNLLITNGVESREVRGPKPEEYPPYQEIIGRVSPRGGGVVFNPKLVDAIIKDCLPLSVRKKDEGPAMSITLSGDDTVTMFKFKLDPELMVISAVTAYLMPLKDVTI